MKKPFTMALMAGLLSINLAPHVHAANVLSFTQLTADPILVNDIVEIELSMQFDDATVGGRFSLLFDNSVLSLRPNDTVFDPGLGDTASLRCPPASGPCGANDVRFGSFASIAAGDHQVATLSFDAVSVGNTTISGSIIDDFFSPTVTPLTVTFNDEEVSVVPIPAAILLFLSGLVGLAGLGEWARRRRIPL